MRLCCPNCPRSSTPADQRPTDRRSPPGTRWHLVHQFLEEPFELLLLPVHDPPTRHTAVHLMSSMARQTGAQYASLATSRARLHVCDTIARISGRQDSNLRPLVPQTSTLLIGLARIRERVTSSSFGWKEHKSPQAGGRCKRVGSGGPAWGLRRPTCTTASSPGAARLAGEGAIGGADRQL